MRILIDTNILIYREDDSVISNLISHVLRNFSQLHTQILIHPESKKDIQKDKNKRRRKIILSKVDAYPLLDLPPNYENNDGFINVVGGDSRPNDRIDNAIIYAVYKDAVELLISEDEGVHKKAQRLGIRDRVLSLEEALELTQQLLKKDVSYSPPVVKEEYIYNLNIDDPFFNSLKIDYSEFEEWLQKISREGRKCWVYYKDDLRIGALLIYKFEDEPISSTPPLPRKKRLKICTLKVSQIGYKMGEFFLKHSIHLAIRNNVEELYLTHFTIDNDPLISLIEEYGFVFTAKNDRGENVYIKELSVDKCALKLKSSTEVAKLYYPFFKDNEDINKFIVPIQPQFHNRLFIEYDYPGKQLTFNDFLGELIVEGNTIKKAYLCHSKHKQLRNGDILLFYRSTDRKELTSLGVVENVYRNLNDVNTIIKYVGKRTVYSIEDINSMAHKPVTVILFTWHIDLKKTIPYGELLKKGILRGPPQSITCIKHTSYIIIKQMGEIDERLAVN